MSNQHNIIITLQILLKYHKLSIHFYNILCWLPRLASQAMNKQDKAALMQLTQFSRFCGTPVGDTEWTNTCCIVSHNSSPLAFLLSAV